MRTAIVLGVLAVGCTHHGRGTIGAGVNAADRGTMGDAIVASALGDESAAAVAALAGHAGEGVSGGAVLFGIEVHHVPSPWGGRFTALAGPALIGEDASVEMRGSFAIERAFRHVEAEHEHGWLTLGVELFVAKIGFSRDDTLLGIGIAFGKLTTHKPGAIAASPPRRSID